MKFRRKYEFAVFNRFGDALFANVKRVISPERLLVRVYIYALDQEMLMIAKRHDDRWVVKLKQRQIDASDSIVKETVSAAS